MEFSNFITELKDFRRKEGQRYSFESLMWSVFLALCCGHTSSRMIAAFCKSNAVQALLVRSFAWEHGSPSYGTIHYFLQGMNSTAMCDAFNAWMRATVSEDMVDDWVSCDGQALRSTVVNGTGTGQNYSALVSLFCAKTGLSIAIRDYQNKHKGEGEQATFLSLLIENLRNKGVMLTLDALHCQKKL